MAGWVGSVIAVAGTLLGATLAYLFQRANALRSEVFTRDERLRQERMAAYSGFAGAMASLRQGVVSLWLVKQRMKDGPELLAAYTEADRLGALANHARLRAQLVAGDARIVAVAGAAFHPIDAISQAPDREKLVSHEKKLLELLDEFISVARDEIQ
ncbi:hypothetical protein ACTI_84980 [Actinoplanes sp. OR16]|uniref:hypothetical protein n=1 Tax=Actinoplanes sp. OR16 TaxID=946334 RepID=UPI000F6D1AB9|nr:hypothetical protein [Actinoplanes sp. OR16]BBH71813.1 hypothetical protein ACTI_84980 [Actinoplanes sp. OR16]